MLRLENISKSFPGVKALQGVSLHFESGSVHAVCGENGAGKTTLMNIIMGNIIPDEGVIYWKEQPVVIDNITTAHNLRIAIVYQERSLVDSLSIAENIYPVGVPVTRAGTIDFPVLFRQTRALLNELGLTNLSPKTLVSKLSVSEKQMVEIARAIAKNPSLLILDEPTASITHTETAILFTIIRKLKERGVGIIYISHRMAEIKEIADVVSVLKDGKFVATVPGTTVEFEIIRMMVGRDLETVQKTHQVQKEIQLEVRNISGKGFFNLSFKIYKGEILGFAGLQGSGRSAMAKALFGDGKFDAGDVLKNGISIQMRHPSEAIANGIVYVPEDRKQEGLFLQQSVARNIFSTQLQKGLYSEAIVNKQAETSCRTFGIRTPTVKQEMRKLSGGNQQKSLLAKWLALQPDILIINEPTHGVDVGSKADIYQLLKRLTAEGKSILLVSSELPELLLLSDRIAVMYQGKIEKILSQGEATEEKIAAIASGVHND